MQSYQKIQSAIRFKFYTLSFDDDEVPSTNLKYFVPGQTLKDAKLLPQYQKVRMLGILFAPQGAELAQKQIVPRIQEFYYRSGNNIDFFCAGYDSSWSEKKPILNFDEKSYNEFRKDIESKTTWKYSGDVDLLLLNAKLNPQNERPNLDWETTIVCQLDSMIKDGAIRSVGEFLESIFKFAENQNGEDPTWGFSDLQGLKKGKNWLIEVVLHLLPKHLADAARGAKHFSVRDVSIAT